VICFNGYWRVGIAQRVDVHRQVYSFPAAYGVFVNDCVMGDGMMVDHYVQQNLLGGILDHRTKSSLFDFPILSRRVSTPLETHRQQKRKQAIHPNPCILPAKTP
jgi:hypothetical protein